MGVMMINAEPRAHANPNGGESQSWWLHQQNISLDEVHPVSLPDWIDLMGNAMADNRAGFEATLIAAFTPSIGWSQRMLEACWRAARRNWAPQVPVP